MVSKFLINKRTLFISAFIILFIAIVTYIFAMMTQIKDILENPQPTMVYDKDNNPIIELQKPELTFSEVPGVVQSFVKERSESLADDLFQESFVERTVCNLLLSTAYSEEEEMDLYLNQMYFNNGVLGLRNASRYYFNKRLEETNQLEKVFLLFQSTDPSNNNQVKEFNKFVDSLYQDKIISEKERKNYIREMPDMILDLHHPKTFAQSYIDAVIDELHAEKGIKEDMLFRSGHKIYTYLDNDIQKSIYTHYQDPESFPKENNEKIESGMVILDHETGGIAGLIGGRKYQETSFNRAYETTRQPASTFKPLMVFAPAIEQGWSPKDRLQDVPMKFGSFQPINYDHDYRGEVSLREGLIMSYNVPAAWLLYKVGLENGMDFIRKFDLFEVDEKDGYKLANGFPRVGTSPLAIAQAYTIFPNGGKMVDVHSVERVISNEGNVIYKEKLEEKEIITRETAKTMMSLLYDVVEDGTGERAQVDGQHIAGKTGTTSYDSWFVGMNDQYVAAIWMGPDKVIPENRLKYGGDRKSLTLFKSIFTELN
jgi:penicillin-binding protein 2A